MSLSEGFETMKLILAAGNGRIAIVESRCSLGRVFVHKELGFPVDPTISKNHCQIWRRGRNFWVRDGASDGLGSLGGTFLDGRRLPVGHWEPIPRTALLRIGGTTLSLRRESESTTDFDIMVSYSRKDEKAVLGLHTEMQNLGIRPWLDQKSNEAATHYLKDIERVMSETNAVAVFWGGEGMGNTQAAEVEVITAFHVQRKIRSVFLIVLPGSQNPQWGAFLDNIDYYDLRKGGERERLMSDLAKTFLPEKM